MKNQEAKMNRESRMEFERRANPSIRVRESTYQKAPSAPRKQKGLERRRSV